MIFSLQLIAEGQSKLASVPSGGAAPAAASGSAPAASSDAAPAEEKKEEAKEEYVFLAHSVPFYLTLVLSGPTTTWASVFSTKRLVIQYIKNVSWVARRRMEASSFPSPLCLLFFARF